MKIFLRILLAIALGWCAVVEVAEMIALRTFNMRLDGDWFLLIAASSGKELAEFVRLYGQQLTLAAAALLVLLALIVAGTFFAKGRWWWCFLALVAAYVGWNCRHPSCLGAWDPLYVAYDTVRGTIQYAELIRAGKWNGEADLKKEGVATNLVFVIGESMTTDRMSLYGYGKPTTPKLDGLRDQLTVLDPVRPNFPDTVRSIRMMCTRASAAKPGQAIETVAVAFRRRGYRPVFIGMQPRWGRYCGVEHLVFGACETRLYVCEDQYQPDEALLPYLQREMSVDDDRPFAIFMQLTGSHFPVKGRVPPWFKVPEGLDDYDQTIYYTDWLLAEMIKILPPRTVLVYASDHGETPDAPNWRDNSCPSLWKVPVIIYPKNYKIQKIQTLDQVFEVLVECIGG